MFHVDLELHEGGFLTETELAELLKCKPSALRRMRREARGPRFCRVGRLIRYPEVWVSAWLRQNEGSREQTDKGPE